MNLYENIKNNLKEFDRTNIMSDQNVVDICNSFSSRNNLRYKIDGNSAIFEDGTIIKFIVNDDSEIEYYFINNQGDASKSSSIYDWKLLDLITEEFKLNESVKVGPVYNVGSEEFVKSFNNIRIDEVGITFEDIELFKRVDTSEEAPDKVNYLLVADVRYDGDKSTSQSIVYNITDREWEQEFEPSFVGVNPDNDLYFTILEDVKSTIENIAINIGL